MAGIAAAISTASDAADLATKDGSKKKESKQGKQIKKTRKILAGAGVATGAFAGADKTAQYLAKEVSASDHFLAISEFIDQSQLTNEVAAKVLAIIQSGEACAMHGDDGQPVAAIIPWEHYQKFHSILGILSWVEGLKGKKSKKSEGHRKGPDTDLPKDEKAKANETADSGEETNSSPESDNDISNTVENGDSEE